MNLDFYLTIMQEFCSEDVDENKRFLRMSPALFEIRAGLSKVVAPQKVWSMSPNEKAFFFKFEDF